MDDRQPATEPKHHEYLAHLFEEDTRFTAVLEGPNYRFVMVNAAYLALVGRGNLVGKEVVEVLPELGKQGYVEILDQVFRTGKPFIGRAVEARLDATAGAEGKAILVDVTVRPLFNSEGAVTALFIQGRDLTPERAVFEADVFPFDT